MSRFRAPQGPASLEDIRDALGKLAREVGNLQRSVQGLRSRLRDEPDENEGKPITSPESLVEAVRLLMDLIDVRRPITPADLKGIRDGVLAVHWGLDDVHRDIGHIRANMDAVANDAELSDEFKSWLRD